MQKWIWAVDRSSLTASQNKAEGYISSDSMTSHCRMTHSTPFQHSLLFLFSDVISFSLQLARNHARSIKWLLFHLKLRSTWVGRCWLASGRKWNIAPCSGSHPIHPCYRSKENNMFFLWCIEGTHSEKGGDQGNTNSAVVVYMEIEGFTPMLYWAFWFHLIQVCALCHIDLGWTQFDSAGLSHGVVAQEVQEHGGHRRTSSMCLAQHGISLLWATKCLSSPAVHMLPPTEGMEAVKRLK